MKYIANDLHETLCSNKHDLNLAGVDLSKVFNYCTMLVYYVGEKFKEKLSLGYHIDCIYYVSDEKYVEK